MKKFTLLGVLAGICLLVKAQQSSLQPLYINDRLPDILLSNIINYKTSVTRLSTLQENNNKMVLFDFWITRCIPCIKKFPQLDSLQRHFKDDLQIILVTSEETEHVKAFLKKWEIKYNMKFSFPIVTADTLLEKYFRQQSKPNYAWLAADNVYMAQTSGAFVTAHNIEAVLKKMKEEVEKRGFIKKNP